MNPFHQEQWIWRNGLLVRVKSRIEVLTKKVMKMVLMIMMNMAFLITLVAKNVRMVTILNMQVDSFNSSIERAGNADSPYLKVGTSKNKRIAQFYYRQYS